MRVFATGAPGIQEWHLAPVLVVAGHGVTATTRMSGQAAPGGAAGAEGGLVRCYWMPPAALTVLGR
jgi:hypothetical protein